MGRKAFGPSKKKLGDTHHNKKKKKSLSKGPSNEDIYKHFRVDTKGV